MRNCSEKCPPRLGLGIERFKGAFAKMGFIATQKTASLPEPRIAFRRSQDTMTRAISTVPVGKRLELVARLRLERSPQRCHMPVSI